MGRLSQKHSSTITTNKNKKPNQQTKNPVSKVKPIGNPKRTIILLKSLSKQPIKMLRRDFQIKINYLKITYTDKNAIEHFSKRNDLVITKADKGRGTVILNVKEYITKG